MKHRLSSARLGAVSIALATVAVAAGAGLAMPATALAADGVGSAYYYQTKDSKFARTIFNENGNAGSFSTVSGLLNKTLNIAKSAYKVVITLDSDWNTKEYGCIKIPDSANVELDLSGHMINRGLANTSFDGTYNGEVFRVGKNATLTIDGGDTSTKHMGTLTSDSLFWKLDITGKEAIEGGLITGGASRNNDKSGGAITTTGEGAKLYLNDVTIAGNVSDTFQSGGGCGGGICIQNDNSTCSLDSSTIIYNRSQGDGGGIYVNGNDSKLTLKGNSIIRSNSADEDGGGIYHNGKRGSVTLKEKSEINSNVAGEDGGGIYDYYNYTTYTISNSYISFNKALGNHDFWTTDPGKGGGICLNDDSDVKLTNGAKIQRNTAVKGGGIFADDDGIEIALEGGSSIEYNTATSTGGGLYLADECTLTLDKSYIYHNTACNGGGVAADARVMFVTRDPVIELKNKSKIYDNIASNAGGGIYLGHERIDPTIISPDGTGLITNNSACYGGAIYAGVSTKIKGLTIKNNTSKEDGAVYVSSILVLEGKNVIENNYIGSKQANVAITPYSSIGAGDSAPSADSSIGITFCDCDDDEQFVFGVDEVAKLAKYPSRALFADDPSVSIRVDDDDLYLSTSPSKFTLSVYGDDDALTESAVAYKSKVELKSADYAKDGSTLVSWSIVGIEGTTSIVPKDGVASFTMPAGNVTVRANYSSVLSEVQLNLSDSSSWADLGSDASAAEISSLRLVAADGNSYGLTTTSEIRKVLKVTDVKASETEAGKTAIYTVELDGAVLKGYGLSFDAKTFDGASVEARASFDTASNSVTEVVSASADKIVIKAEATYLTPGDAVTIDAVNVNKAGTDAKPFDTVVEQAEEAAGSGGMQLKQIITRVKIKAPSEPGWSFSAWSNLPSSAVVDESDNSVTIDADDANAKITALYEPLVSAIAISIDEPKIGESFPTTINACLMAGANERDLTEYLQSVVKVSWSLADGMPAGDTAQSDTIYKVTLTAEGVDNSSYIFGKDDSVYLTVNGAQVYSSEYDAGTKTGRIVYYVKTGEDTRFDYAISNMPAVTVASADAVEGNLPTEAYYVLKNGTVKTADVAWDTSALDTSSTATTLSLEGVFKDETGAEHSVTQPVVISNAAAFIDSTFTISKAVCSYAKGGCTPSITVKVGDKTLAKGTDYKVAYTNSKKVGIAYVTIMGIGDYEGIGIKMLAYKVIPAKVKGASVKSTSKHEAKVSWSEHKAQTTGFQVRYAASKAKLAAGKGKVVKVKGAAKTQRVIKGLKSGKKIYVQVRAYTKATDGEKCYSKWSAVKAVKVK